MGVVILTGSVQSITADDVRCPYCVSDYEFRPMLRILHQFFCLKCGHIVDLQDEDFICECPKCQEVDRHSKYGTLP